MARSGKESSLHQSSSMADEDFYNPMPMKNFNKNYQPSLAFSSSNSNSHHLRTASNYLPPSQHQMTYYPQKPGIELIGNCDGTVPL